MKTAWLARVTARIERTSGVDRVSEPANRAAVALLKPGPSKDMLSGSWLGHPLHPVLVGIPIGSWVSASVLDLGGDNYQPAARRLIGLGLLTALPTALAGLSDWSDTAGPEQRVGALHAGLNLAAVALYGASWLARRRARGSGPVLALAGGAALAAAGYLGGHLSYAMGVGVDTNAFQSGPQDWQPVASESELVEGQPLAASSGGVSLMLVKQGDRVHALANRCSHRGGPLADGDVEGGCVTCPWHASRFDLATGAVVRGPATAPQPVYEVRTVDGRVEVRRREARTLRTNPVAGY